MNKPYILVTIWSRPHDLPAHNHFKEGWSKKDRPVGHSSWVKGPWVRQYGYLLFNSYGLPEFDVILTDLPHLRTMHEIFKILGV